PRVDLLYCLLLFSCRTILRPPTSPLFPYTTLFRSAARSRSSSSPGFRPREAIASAPPSGSASTSPAGPEPASTGCALPSMPMLEIGRAQSELQSRGHLVCRLLLEKKKTEIV